MASLNMTYPMEKGHCFILSWLAVLLPCCWPHSLCAQGAPEHRKFQSTPALGYYWQGLGTYEIRWRTLYYTRKIPHENVSLETSVALFSRHGLYAAPQLGLKYYRPVFISRFTGRFAISPRINYWLFFSGGRARHYVTPEAGVTWAVFNLAYGYNFPLSGQRVLVMPHRVALRIEVF